MAVHSEYDSKLHGRVEAFKLLPWVLSIIMTKAYKFNAKFLRRYSGLHRK